MSLFKGIQVASRTWLHCGSSMVSYICLVEILGLIVSRLVSWIALMNIENS